MGYFNKFDTGPQNPEDRTEVQPEVVEQLEVPATEGVVPEQEVVTEEVQQEVQQEVVETPTEEVVEQVQQEAPVEQEVLPPPVEENINQESISTESTTQVEQSDTLEDSRVLDFLSEKLGSKVDSFESLKESLLKEPESPLDPDLQKLKDWKEKTGRPLSDWVNYQKDYDSMSNLDVAREFLRHSHPDLTDKEIELDMDRFNPDEDDLDDEAARKSLNLKKFAGSARKELNNSRIEFGEPTSSVASLSQEQASELDFAKEVRGNIAKSNKASEDYNNGIGQASSRAKSLPIKLSDDMSIEYNLTDQDRREAPDMISKMDHWYNPDGSFNHDAVVQDAFYLKNKDAITKISYQQGFDKGREDVLKGMNNSTLSKDGVSSTSQGALSNKSHIEGFDEMFSTGFGGFKNK